MSTETEAQTIEVGDTVKATHAESGSVVQGVVQYLENGEAGIENIEFQTGVDERFFADVYVGTGWTFEVVSKAVKPPKVGDPWREGLPVGTVLTFTDNSGLLFQTTRGWHTLEGKPWPWYKPVHSTIVYLPEANDVPF